MSKQPKKVGIVRSGYQPKKAELEADTRLTEGGPITMESFEKAAKRLVRGVDIRWLKRPQG